MKRCAPYICSHISCGLWEIQGMAGWGQNHWYALEDYMNGCQETLYSCRGGQPVNILTGIVVSWRKIFAMVGCWDRLTKLTVTSFVICKLQRLLCTMESRTAIFGWLQAKTSFQWLQDIFTLGNQTFPLYDRIPGYQTMFLSSSATYEMRNWWLSESYTRDDTRIERNTDERNSTQWVPCPAYQWTEERRLWVHYQAYLWTEEMTEWVHYQGYLWTEEMTQLVQYQAYLWM